MKHPPKVSLVKILGAMKDAAPDTIFCKKCGSTEHQKCGYVKDMQRYKCKNCHCQFTQTERGSKMNDKP